MVQYASIQEVWGKKKKKKKKKKKIEQYSQRQNKNIMYKNPTYKNLNNKKKEQFIPLNYVGNYQPFNNYKQNQSIMQDLISLTSFNIRVYL